MNNLQLMKNQKKNAMSEYLLKIQIIVTHTEFKNKDEADKYETLDSRLNGDKYCRAMNHTDIFESYEYNPIVIYQTLIEYGFDDQQAQRMLHDLNIIPYPIKQKLMVSAREQFIASYTEPNPYYVMLTGKPFQGTTQLPPEHVVTIPDEFYNIYQNEHVISRNQAIHELPPKYQELFMNSKYYQQVLDENPNHPYLKYIGSNAIPIHVARKAHDGDIMKINTDHLTMSHPVFGNVSVESDLIHLFTNVYQDTHKYIYQTLRGDFNDIYPNYNSFIRFLTIYMAIGGCMNELMKKSTSMIYMNQTTANDFFMLYGLPSVIMSGQSMISFLKQFRLILMDKGTNIVYRVKDLIGYEYTDIYTLVMVKQQVFEQGKPKFIEKDGERVPVQEIVFRRLGTTADNTSYFKYRDSDISYPWETIASGDPRWWNTPEMESILNDMNYTLSNSKYIQLSTHLSMSDIYWQCVILIRGLLDNRNETQYTNIALSTMINGKSEMSIFEAVLILEILMNWQITTARGDSLRGDMYLPNGRFNGAAACLDMLFNGLQYYDPVLYPDVTQEQDGLPNPLIEGLPYKVSSFNFNLRTDDNDFYQSIQYMEYLEPETLYSMLDRIYDRNENNVGSVLMGDVKKVFSFLETKLQQASNIHEFRQVTEAYNHLFLVDPNRNWYDEGTINVDAYLTEAYQLSYNELTQLKTFFEPNHEDLTIEYQNETFPISIYNIMNEDAYTLEINGTYPFQQNQFVSLFQTAMDTYQSEAFISARGISSSLKNVYTDVIVDKVILDTGNNLLGPKTFDALLFRMDASTYRYLVSLKSNPDMMLMTVRSIVKSLESYVNTSLSGLEFKALGEDNYFDILKQVIGYFKSYMVEYTKDEFVYIFDGLFDHGGNSNMLNLYDEISHGLLRVIPKDSLTLHDASHALRGYGMEDYGLRSLYDEAQVHRRVTYKKIKELGYDIIFDTGKKLTQTPDNLPDDNDKVEFSLYQTGNTYQVRIYL